MQTDALAVADAWGFRVVGEVVWQKLTKRGRPWFGMGRTVRASHETALVCLRGPASALIQSRAIRSTFAAPVPTYGPGHPCVGQPLLDELGRPLLGRRGRPRAIRVGDYIHSAKPEAFFTEVVEPLVCGPYVELFARRRRRNWHAIGNQLARRNMPEQRSSRAPSHPAIRQPSIAAAISGKAKARTRITRGFCWRSSRRSLRHAGARRGVQPHRAALVDRAPSSLEALLAEFARTRTPPASPADMSFMFSAALPLDASGRYLHSGESDRHDIRHRVRSICE
jgi:N6-adenosine-specific RNA methylase IME4